MYYNNSVEFFLNFFFNFNIEFIFSFAASFLFSIYKTFYLRMIFFTTFCDFLRFFCCFCRFDGNFPEFPSKAIVEYRAILAITTIIMPYNVSLHENENYFSFHFISFPIFPEFPEIFLHPLENYPPPPRKQKISSSLE